MRVFVTGGNGRVGRPAVERLLGAGHSVTVIGAEEKVDLGAAVYHRCDICDFDSLLALMRGHDSVVHLAAIPHPVGRAGRELFRVNALGAFNVYEAAAECGIVRVVSVSSINSIGYFYGDRGFPVRYLPIDEEHAGNPTDAYSFSKATLERIGSYFWERDRISGVMIRFPGVIRHERVIDTEALSRGDFFELLGELLSLDVPTRRERVRLLHEAYDRLRRSNRPERRSESSDGSLQAQFDAHMGAGAHSLMTQVVNFFAYVDVLDGAQAIEKALIAEYEGCIPIFVNAAMNRAGLPIPELASLYWPPVERVRNSPDGSDSLVSIDRARSLIGYEPQWAMRTGL